MLLSVSSLIACCCIPLGNLSLNFAIVEGPKLLAVEVIPSSIWNALISALIVVQPVNPFSGILSPYPIFPS